MKNAAENPWVIWSAAAICATTLCGGVFWLSTMFSQGQATADMVKQIQVERRDERKEYTDHLIKLETDIAAIKEDVKAIRKGE